MEEQNKKILLVEDDPNFGTVLRDYLTMNDYDVVHAKNGMEGFEKFKKDDYDLCILDVMMPYKDGFTLAKEIREKNTDVPIIFLTAKAMKEDVLKGYKIGADLLLTPHIAVEAAYDDKDRTGLEDEWYAKILFVHPPREGVTAQDGMSSDIWKNEKDMSGEMLAKVKRNNKIMVEFKGSATISRLD